MARLGKPLAVAAFVLCVLFCGFAAAISAGGQNWDARAAELDEFSITPVGGGDQPIRYQVTDRVTTETVTTADSLPAAVVAAYREKTTRTQAERQALQDRVDRMEAEVPRRTQLNKADLIAMDARIAAQQAEYEELTREVEELTAEGARLAAQAEQLRSEAATRAEDADRLDAELDAIRTDAYRIDEQIEALKDRLVRLEGALARAERRRQQLTERLE
ncbi:hypothetical protein [Alienimonas sp. DA493]|uniref:hypothetical protein n=1 Tax=Alienimonas sp. DA493 TaxID=3373605 RepID=UPI003754EC33